MIDRAIESISNRTNDNISFLWLRSHLKAEHSLRSSLNYGRAVIDTIPKLDQYLYSYGPMIESQWHCILPLLQQLNHPTRLIDYGCGQGLGGLLLNDVTSGGITGEVNDVLLIEPSPLALARAVAIYECLFPQASIRTICKRFDDVLDSDTALSRTGHTLHIFSNSLDVTGFDPLTLLGNTLSVGRHTILAVSHDRNFDGGTPRIESVQSALEAAAAESYLTIHRSTMDRFVCDNPTQSKGVVWICEFEVNDG